MSKRCVILLVEDEDIDVLLFERAWRKSIPDVEAEFHPVPDGQTALDYLQGHGQYTDRSAYPLPTLVLLDLKLPRLDGFEVLEWIRAQPAFRALPVIIHSSSDLPSDVERARALGAAAFWIKSHAFPELKSRVVALIAYARGALAALPDNRL